MNLSPADWAIVGLAVLLLRWQSWRMLQPASTATEFLVANRAAGRYLIATSRHMGTMGVISFLALWEMFSRVGLTVCWWEELATPTRIIITLSGWIFYRYRETRCMTMPEFLEKRYSRKLRISAACVCWISGVLNFALFPVIAARFFVYFCGLDPAWIPAIMALDLAVALMLLYRGGQVSVMVTECLQGIFVSLAFIAVIATILIRISWGEMVAALEVAAPAGTSMLDPFQTSASKDFNAYYFSIGIFAAFYSYMSWQGSAGLNASGRSPHEQKMSQVVGGWRYRVQSLFIVVVALAALVVLKLPRFAETASNVADALGGIQNDAVRSQMRVPIAMAHFLPHTVRGLFATAFLFFSFTCHDTYMHSWGSMLVQDIVLPLRRKSVSAETHLRLLRWSMTLVAFISFSFGCWYEPTELLMMWMAITGSVWVAGSGAIIIGGLYWKRGTPAGAFAALIIGASLGVFGVVAPKLYREWPFSGQTMFFVSALASMFAYVLASAATCRDERDEADLDSILNRHRSGWKVSSNCIAQGFVDFDKTMKQIRGPVEIVNPSRWRTLLGITPEFTRTDRWQTYAFLAWEGFQFLTFAVFTAMALLGHPQWPTFYFIAVICASSVIAVPAAVWFAVGGLRDIGRVLKSLNAEKNVELVSAPVITFASAGVMFICSSCKLPIYYLDTKLDITGRCFCRRCFVPETGGGR